MFEQLNAPYSPEFCNEAGTYRVDVGPAFYVGSTTRLGQRHSSHRVDLERGQHPNKRLQAAWDEHRDFRFTVLTLIPRKEIDQGRDHVERLKFHEQLLLDQLFADPNCCNASENSRYNTTISDVMKAKWRDPEFRATHTARLREHRTPPGPETRARMAAAKRGLAGVRSRPCVLDIPGRGELAFESASEAARFVGVSQQLLHQWLTGAAAWPGTGPRKPRRPGLVGLRGRFIERADFPNFEPGFPSAEPRRIAPARPAPTKPPRPAHMDRSRKLIEVELVFEGRDPERFVTIHDAAKRAKTRHLVMFQWLTGERPWPIGLTGRVV